MVLLFLNSIAGSEIIIILLFVLIFFGAKSIPGMSRSLGRGIRQIKSASQDVQDEIRRTTSDMKNEMNLKRTIDQVAEDVKKPMNEMVENIEESSSSVEERFKIKDAVPHQNKPKDQPSNSSKNQDEKEEEETKKS